MEAGDTKLQKMKAVLESLRKESEEKEEEKKRIQEEGKKEELRLRTKEETVVKAMKELEIEKEGGRKKQRSWNRKWRPSRLLPPQMTHSVK